MKCLTKYPWVKYPRSLIPSKSGLLGNYIRLYARAAYRTGQARYCQYINDVRLGEWVGGVVGLKSILGVSTREKAFSILRELSDWGFIEYDYNTKTKRLSYRILHIQIATMPEQGIPVYSKETGFICLPRTLTQPLIQAGYTFGESDAWLDLWIHTIHQDANSFLSTIVPLIQFDSGPALTLEFLGKRWGWERTKVWRFMKKHAHTFHLFKLPGSYGSVICNTCYAPKQDMFSVQAQITRYIRKILTYLTISHRHRLSLIHI